VLSSLLLTTAAGAVAGGFGSVFGLGGGFLLVPFFELMLGLPFATATGLSLMTIVGNSAAVSAAPEGRELVNTRLAMVLQILTVAGAVTGTTLLSYDLVSDRFSKRVFGVVAIFGAVAMLARLNKRNIITEHVEDVGELGGRVPDGDTGRLVAYHIRRLPLAASASFIAGIVSSLSGIGGGVVIVPALNSWCGVPLRVAAATSAIVIGVTAIPGVLSKFPFADVFATELAAVGVLGVLLGSKAGLWLSPRAPVRTLKLVLAVILIVLGARYLVSRS